MDYWIWQMEVLGDLDKHISVGVQGAERLNVMDSRENKGEEVMKGTMYKSCGAFCDTVEQRNGCTLPLSPLYGHVSLPVSTVTLRSRTMTKVELGKSFEYFNNQFSLFSG